MAQVDVGVVPKKSRAKSQEKRLKSLTGLKVEPKFGDSNSGCASVAQW